MGFFSKKTHVLPALNDEILDSTPTTSETYDEQVISSPELVRLEAQIASIEQEISNAAAAQDFERAASLQRQLAGLSAQAAKEKDKARRALAKKRGRAARKKDISSDDANQDDVRFVYPDNATARMVPYEKLFSDGIMDLGDGQYSMSVAFDDTNYSLARPEDKEAINRAYSDWMNSFQEGENFEFTFVVKRTDKRSFERDYQFEETPGEDIENVYRREYNAYLKAKMTSASASMSQKRIVTFTCQANDHESAARHFAGTIKTFGRFVRRYKCGYHELSGQQRMDLINSITKPDEPTGKYTFGTIGTNPTITTRDLVAPTRVFRPAEDKEDSRLIVGNRWVKSYSILPTDGGWGATNRDDLIADLTGAGHDMVISLHAAPWSVERASKVANSKYLDIVDENTTYKINRSRPQQGYFIDDTNMPKRMQEAEEGAIYTRDQLVGHHQRMFGVCMVISVFGRSEAELAAACHDVEAVFQVHSKPGLESWKCVREQSYSSMLPLGVCTIPYVYNMMTEPLSALVPFHSAEYQDKGGVLLGVNADTNNLLMYSRPAREHTNAMVLGQSRGGKSVFVKTQILQTYLSDPTADQIILDPEGEYVAGVMKLGMQVVKISENSHDFVNPLDISAYYGSSEPTAETSPLSAKTSFIRSLVQKMTHQITAGEQNALDLACTRIYEKWLSSHSAEDIPTLTDLQAALNNLPHSFAEDGKHLASLLYRFVDGTFDLFNHKTNVDLHARIVDFSLVDMSPELKSLAMLILMDQIWVRVTKNLNEGRRTYLWIDEMQLLIDDPHALHTLDMFWSRGRKWDLYNCGITQSADRIENIQETSYMLANSPFLVFMKQSADYATELAEIYGLSEDQRDILASAKPGEGMVIIDNQPIHFDCEIDKELMPMTYEFVTTSPDDLRARRLNNMSKAHTNNIKSPKLSTYAKQDEDLFNQQDIGDDALLPVALPQEDLNAQEAQDQELLTDNEVNNTDWTAPWWQRTKEVYNLDEG